MKQISDQLVFYLYYLKVFEKKVFEKTSLLPLLSKGFEKTMYDQLYEYADTFLNKLFCGFRKARSTQHALFRLFQKWQKKLDSSGIVGAILMDIKIRGIWP